MEKEDTRGQQERGHMSTVLAVMSLLSCRCCHVVAVMQAHLPLCEPDLQRTTRMQTLIFICMRVRPTEKAVLTSPMLNEA